MLENSVYRFIFDHMTDMVSHQRPSCAAFSRCFRKAITTLAFSPDGKYVVTGEVGLWSWSPVDLSGHVDSVIINDVFMLAQRSE